MEEDKKCETCGYGEGCCEREVSGGDPTECACDSECQEADCEDCAADRAEWAKIRADFEFEQAQRNITQARMSCVLAWLYIGAIGACIAVIVVDIALRVW